MRQLKPRFVKMGGRKPLKPVMREQFMDLTYYNIRWFAKTHRTWWGKKLRALVLVKAENDFEPYLIEVSTWISCMPKISTALHVIKERDEISRALAENHNRVVVFR